LAGQARSRPPNTSTCESASDDVTLHAENARLAVDGRRFHPDSCCCGDPTSIAQKSCTCSTPTPIRTHGLRSSSMCQVSNHSSFSRPSLDTDVCGEGLAIREPAGHRNTLLGWPNLVAVGGKFQLAHSVTSDKQLNLPCACSTGVLRAE
jgi:hypothetical protein